MEYLIKDSGLIADVSVKEGIVSGYFSSFDDVPDSDGDIIQKGAFTKTIQENGPKSRNRIKHLLDHDHTKGIGKLTELYEDQKGLAYVSQLGKHTLGVDVLKMIEAGIITEHSIGFGYSKEPIKKENHNILTELKLWEGSSLQSWGANMNTPITGLKSYEDLLVLFTKLNKALQSGTFTDETFLKIQEQYNALSQYFKTTEPDAKAKDEPTQPDEDEAKKEEEKNLELIKQFKLSFENGRGK